MDIQQDQSSQTAARPNLAQLILVGLASFAVAMASRVALLSYPPIYDELYQMTPAISFWQDGTYGVLDGVYDRGWSFTQLVARSFDLFGEPSLAAARLLPSAVPGALLVTLATLWVWCRVGAIGAASILFLLTLWPTGIEVSQFVRFYAVHGLIFVTAALMIYTALAGTGSLFSRGLWLVACLPLLAYAAHLQLVTIVGLAGLGLWVVVMFLPGWLKHYPLTWLVLLGGVIAAIALVALVPEKIAWYLTVYQWAPWPGDQDPFFYHRHLRDSYPTLWPLFPVAVLIAIAAIPRAGTFAAAIFGTSIVMQSFGGLKNIWYLYSTLPFFFIVWAMAAQAVLPGVVRLVRSISSTAASALVPARHAGLTGTVLAALAAVFLLAGNAGFERAVNLVAGSSTDRLLGKTRWSWDNAPDALAPWIKDRALIVTTEEMMAVTYLGDFDIGYNRTRFSELQFSISPYVAQFTEDWRHGRPIFGDRAEFARLVACAPVGVVVANRPWITSEDALTLKLAAQETGAIISADVQGDVGLLGWRNTDWKAPANGCEPLQFAPGTMAADRFSPR